MKPLKDIVLVSIQAVLLVGYLFRIPRFDVHFHHTACYAGLCIAIVGGVVILYSIITLNTSLTPFPSPKSNGQLITSGLYKYIRHPIYTGILLFTSGYGVYSNSGFRLIISLALFVLFIYKAKYEEGMLKDKFPGSGEYMSATHMFLPKIF